MLPHHESELQRRIETIFHAGQAAIARWEQSLWYGCHDSDTMYVDVLERYSILFEAFYGDREDVFIQVLRQPGQTVFLNDELLVRLDHLMYAKS